MQGLLVASHNGYTLVIHKRTITWDAYSYKLNITDELNQATSWQETFLLGPKCIADIKSDKEINILLNSFVCRVQINSPIEAIELLDEEFSPCYGKKEMTKMLKITGYSDKIALTMHISIG